MRRPVSGWLGCFVLAMGLLASSSASAQGRGDYFNIESPQVHPIEVVLISGHYYILVCNTADNSIEIWDSDENLPVASRFLARVPVGLEPVSVRYVPSLTRFFVANFLGDSISSVFINAPTGPSSLFTRVIATRPVTDEPLDIAFAEVDNGGEDLTPTLFITHMTLDAYSEYNAVSLFPVAPGTERMDALVPQTIDHDFDGNFDDIALKAPRTLAVACDKLFVLGFMGGNTVRYDFDLYSEDLSGAGATQALGGIGSTNWNMEFADDNNLFLVGAEALNSTLFGESTVKNAQTGFVENTFYWVQNPCSANPTILTRDVNEILLEVQQFPGQPHPNLPVPISSRGPLDSAVDAGITASNTRAVAKKDALVQLTDIELLKDDTGQVDKAFFTAYGSDRVGIIEPRAGQAPIKWKRRIINTPPVNSPVGTFIGARGLALKAANPGNDTDPGDRLYVVNRLESSVTIIDPLTETVVGGFSLNNDMNPVHIKAGREFLYSAKLSGNGFVACASCHMDGRTDGLAWDLGDGNTVTIPQKLLPFGTFPTEFPGEKGFMVTQSLQGLLNWDVEPEIQQLFTNAPYHWRGDRETFRSFNGAFGSLLGGAELEDDEMIAYENFINSIHYPPNPKQQRTRILTGDLADPDDDNTTVNVQGDGALLGLKFFHIVNSDGFSCNGCHTLPEGSDNVLTENIQGLTPHPVVAVPPGPPSGFQPQETSALRFLFQKEARLDRDGSDNPDNSPITGFEGMFHTGLNRPSLALNDFNGTATMNAFNARFFQGICPTSTSICFAMQALNQFLHEFDTGTGPQVGRTHTVNFNNVNDPLTTGLAFNEAEAEAFKANASVAVRANLNDVARGFWLDFSGSVPLYREEPGGATFTRAALLALVTGTRDRMFLMSTPLGSEIRVAAPSGIPTIPTGTAPATLQLQPMVPNTAHADIPSLSVFWDNGNPTFGGTMNHTMRLYQNALINDAPGGFGLCTVRHEAPRRFRVSGKGIRHGAKLHLFVQDDASLGAPKTNLRVDDDGQVPTLRLELPIHPTDRFSVDGTRIWETAAEMEALIYYRLMAGIPSAPAGVLDDINALDFGFQIPFELQPVGTWKPVTWNNHWVRVVNTDGTQGDGGWQQLTIEPGPLCP
ncbi:MAG: hypothetical protein K0U98_17045 [Deltaproteobacteria bacterium]|nr:hypothetical protein [Deltaproteobacteria bacterium]